jgi:hypothetical protein
MSPRAAAYEAGAPGAIPGKAPVLKRTANTKSGERNVKFDGIDGDD